MSNWSNWTTCSTTCGEGIQTRNRTIIQQPQLGGLPCGNLTETQTCNTQLCPVDCQVGNWSSWSSCSVTCGNGTQTRTRNIAINASNGGIACPTLLENQTCNMPACTTNNSQCTDNYPRWNHDSEEDHFTWNRKIFSDFQEKTNPFQRIRTNFFSRFWNSFRR
jgi:predicted molibdopterin-dependent oxidoreductase YjgC